MTTNSWLWLYSPHFIHTNNGSWDYAIVAITNMPGTIQQYTNCSTAGYHINGDYYDNGVHCFITNGVVTTTIGPNGFTGNASGLTNIPPTSLSAGTTFNNVDIPTNALGTHGYSGYFTNGVFVSTGTY